MFIFLYACESWTLTADTERRIQAMGMRCLRKLLGNTYIDHISNEEVRNRTRQAIGPHEDLLITAKRRKLKWNGHVTKSTGLAKTIQHGTVQGGRRRGRQKKILTLKLFVSVYLPNCRVPHVYVCVKSIHIYTRHTDLLIGCVLAKTKIVI